VRGAAVITLALLIADSSPAQTPSARSTGLEVRLDGIVASRATAAHAGLGLTRRAARHLEMQLVGAAGVTVRDGSEDASASGRADLLARFAPAPDDPNRWSAYAGGGVSALMERGMRGRAVLALLVGARNRRLFFEAGLGGGVRLGSGIRF
jgi:hypothetical protein